MPEIRLYLDKILEEKNISRYALAKATGTQYQIIDNYYKNRVERYDKDLILRMCLYLQCEPGDLIKIVDKWRSSFAAKGKRTFLLFRYLHVKNNRNPISGLRLFLAEMERFELSIPFWGIHDFQSCALDQLRDISVGILLFGNGCHYNGIFR